MQIFNLLRYFIFNNFYSIAQLAKIVFKILRKTVDKENCIHHLQSQNLVYTVTQEHVNVL